MSYSIPETIIFRSYRSLGDLAGWRNRCISVYASKGRGGLLGIPLGDCLATVTLSTKSRYIFCGPWRAAQISFTDGGYFGDISLSAAVFAVPERSDQFCYRFTINNGIFIEIRRRAGLFTDSTEVRLCSEMPHLNYGMHWTSRAKNTINRKGRGDRPLTMGRDSLDEIFPSKSNGETLDLLKAFILMRTIVELLAFGQRHDMT